MGRGGGRGEGGGEREIRGGEVAWWSKKERVSSRGKERWRNEVMVNVKMSLKHH